ncbi:hypothetical protein BCR33DRAFT_452970 [Rhizoclosmatium globosum]|uniref:ABC-type glycine betaine transport system substrate-binding domain-containing protein n=1 Tax=Rhizoclosmatium globosum TaxID=329046 RepID=A0A1Y2CWV3_9FUNG|nr:hypothetical protein BCR33DRAFT_452970 [Rhizoclosmatium globosum]|eukprot:ORY51366.1 hypothetical protein BCR33DRAFT_452970 [Rhizoclosmatium globosum]
MMLQHITLLLLLLVVQTYQHPQEVYLNGAIKRQPLSSKYIINKFSSTNSSGDSTTNATILANLMGDLLIDNMKFPRCWNGSRKGWEKFANYTQSKRPILLEQDAWDSARLATNIFYRLAGEVMGFPVRYMEFTGGYDNVLGPRLQAGAVDVVMEMWITGIPVTWFDHGSVGYQGRSGMYIPTWLAQSDVTLAFDFWRFFQNPKAINTFKTKSWKPIVNNPDGTPICTGILKGCQNNTYHPAWWTPETDQNFVTMWHIDPSWSQYHYERLIDGLGINATITWLGGNNFYNIVGQALKNNTPCVFYQWKPSSFVAVNNVTRLMFPDSDNGLTLKWLIDPVNSPIGQDEATTIITKVKYLNY